MRCVLDTPGGAKSDVVWAWVICDVVFGRGSCWDFSFSYLYKIIALGVLFVSAFFALSLSGSEFFSFCLSASLSLSLSLLIQ